MRDVVRMVVVLTVVAVLAALGLARVYEVTREPIREARRQELLRAVRAVLPPFENEPDRETVDLGGVPAYPGRSGGNLVGVAFPISSPEGYSGAIEALAGVDPQGRVTGVAVLAHAETPGLGAKFTAPGYLAQFRGKTLEGSQWAVRKDGGDFDQITGATITPRALVKALKEGLERFAANRESLLGALEHPPGASPPAGEEGKP